MATNELVSKSLRLYIGKVSHQRFFPISYRFIYRIFSIAVDIDKLEEAFSQSRIISLNKWNLLSFYQKDFGSKGKISLRNWADQSLKKAGINSKVEKIELFCFPRILGYTFNPLSIWYCYKNDKLIAAILEVRNTFKESYSYIINFCTKSSITGHASKSFHVSPFINMNSNYKFKLKITQSSRTISIHQYQNDELLLVANQFTKEVPFTSKSLLSAFFSIPLMTWKIIIMIHWQALKIWLKGAKFHTHPSKYDSSKD